MHIGTGSSIARDEDQNRGTNFNADFCKKAVDYELIIFGGYSAELHGWAAKTANIGAAFRQIPQSTVIFYVGR